ncbi:methionine ABC transporter ATP-binding protein, partial [Xanthomonas citri pv. citri]|nr:methionine ABC transporter ATP-binding protein [Xanthomonas citri pv. citri]
MQKGFSFAEKTGRFLRIVLRQVIALINLQDVSKVYKSKHGDVNAVQ